MTEDKQIRLQELAYRWLKGTLTEAEQLEFDLWFVETGNEPMEIPADVALSRQAYKALLFNRIRQETLGVKKLKRFPYWTRISTAAAAIFMIAATAVYFYKQGNTLPEQAVRFANDIKAGGNKAYLTLSDGKRITLTDAGNGTLATQSGVRIIKTADGQLTYKIADQSNAGNNLYNSIETPRGGMYTILLPDGSKVWLNAASSIKYPASFAGLKQRRIELSGEAYLEIAKDKQHPFIVSTAKQEVTVLGTHFNVSSYPEDANVKTTLLEGSVQLSSKQHMRSKVLLPGEQAILSEGKILVDKNVDLEEVVAWKAGYFKFNDNLENIMIKVARWYDVEVVYQTRPDPKLAFGAEISRSRNISDLLKIIESTGAVHFKIEGRRIIVM